MKHITNTTRGISFAPQSFITKGKQRLKQYSNTVYLNNEDEFEIEFFNPTQNKVLAEISLNGKSLNNGLILRPGERIFLERYFDDPKKFVFKTYNVNGKNTDVQKAIANNGDIMIKFYAEQISKPLYFNPTYYIPYQTTINPYYFADNIITAASGVLSSNTSTVTNNCFYSNTNSVNSSSYREPTNIGNKLSKSNTETGRIEKGSYSNQSFSLDNTTFNTSPSWTCWWKILPFSQKAISREDIKVFCSKCSRKKRKGDVFCPVCGQKL